jgi:hypothetical protein
MIVFCFAALLHCESAGPSHLHFSHIAFASYQTMSAFRSRITAIVKNQVELGSGVHWTEFVGANLSLAHSRLLHYPKE